MDTGRLRHPRLRADYQPVLCSGPEGAYLVVVGEHRNLLIDDRAVVDLAPLLDGTRTVERLAALVADRHPLAAVTSGLRRLAGLGLLAEGPAGTRTAVAAGWDARGVAPDAAEQWAAIGRVLLVDAGSPVTALIADRLAPAVGRLEVVSARDPGLAVMAAGDAQIVVAPGSYLDGQLGAVNEACLSAGRPWTLIRAHGSVLVLGPHLIPGVTGCWQCLRQRWLENEQVENYLAGHDQDGNRVTVARAVLPGTVATAAGLLAAELPVLAVAGRSPRLTGRMTTLDTRDLTTEQHELVRQPQCPACGEPALTRAADPRIALAAGAATDVDGGTRTAPAAEVEQRLTRHVSRYLGVVTRLDPLTGPDDLTQSWISGHNFAVARHPAGLRKSLRGMSGGKGRTVVQAKVSAIAEAIERYSAVWRDDRPVRRATYADLDPATTVHPRDLLLFSDKQYANRGHSNAAGGHFHRVPAPLADDQPLDWSTAWSLTHDAPRDVPAAYCWYGHPDVAALDVCAPDSNGCSAGNTVAEAILQGLGELVERDSVALWWYHRSRLPGVDLASFADPWIDALRTHYASVLGRELWALDLTADLGMPAYAAVSRHLERPTEDVILGFGSHLDPATALGRALTELNQFLPIVARFADGRTRYGITDPDTVTWYRTVRVAEQPWLTPDPERPPSTAATHRRAGTGDVAGDVRHCIDRLARAGLEVIVLDQSRPDLDLAVVKVMVPGLRHFWRRLGPGRLWDVPAALGRSPRAAGEDSINPLSVFF
jgi:ribosomal protein S12 methylthiotransferase accessory factor